LRRSYDYARRTGVETITWDRFAELARTLAEKLAPFSIDAVVGTARAGLFPATAVSLMLRCEIYPVRVSRRVNDELKFRHPQWIVDVAADVKGRIVAVVDEIADTGETLEVIAERVKQRGARRVITASLVAHSWADPAPDAPPRQSRGHGVSGSRRTRRREFSCCFTHPHSSTPARKSRRASAQNARPNKHV
jgi:hypoxanthine phosphoribosyltransferase